MIGDVTLSERIDGGQLADRFDAATKRTSKISGYDLDQNSITIGGTYT